MPESEQEKIQYDFVALVSKRQLRILAMACELLESIYSLRLSEIGELFSDAPQERCISPEALLGLLGQLQYSERNLQQEQNAVLTNPITVENIRAIKTMAEVFNYSLIGRPDCIKTKNSQPPFNYSASEPPPIISPADSFLQNNSIQN